jgi:hypothetical protein
LGLGNICPSEDNFDVVGLINCSWTLVRNYRATLKTISDLESQGPMIYKILLPNYLEKKWRFLNSNY